MEMELAGSPTLQRYESPSRYIPIDARLTIWQMMKSMGGGGDADVPDLEESAEEDDSDDDEMPALEEIKD